MKRQPSIIAGLFELSPQRLVLDAPKVIDQCPMATGIHGVPDPIRVILGQSIKVVGKQPRYDLVEFKIFQ